MIPDFPDFVPVSFELRDELIPFFSTIHDGICEHTFASLFLDSYKYRYDISRFGRNSYLVLGVENTEPGLLCARLGLTCRFLHILGDFPSAAELRDILADPAMAKCCHLRTIPERVAVGQAELFSELKLSVELDRDNSDYLYDRVALSELRGKAFHKKKNLVNQFVNGYTGEVRPISDGTVSDAIAVLNAWKASRTARGEDEGDFLQCSLALQYWKELRLSGIVLYADSQPAGFSLGEAIGDGSMYDVHFEKGIDGVHGIYQAVNWYTAQFLPPEITLINREQDLGDAGLRQAKLTYRPCGMVNKYRTSFGVFLQAMVQDCDYEASQKRTDEDAAQ